MKLFPCKDGFLVSNFDCWLPGVYETKDAAELAIKISDKILIVIQNKLGQKPISAKDLQPYLKVKH